MSGRTRGLIEVRDGFCAVTDGALRLVPAAPKRSGNRERVLVVRLDRIGDFVLWLDAARGIRARYPSDRFELTLVCDDAVAELARLQTHFDTVLPVDTTRLRNDLAYRLRTLFAIRRVGFETALHPTFSRRHRFSDAEAVLRASAARVRIGWEGDGIDGWRSRWSRRWYTVLLPKGRESSGELDRNAEFVRRLGVDGFRAGRPCLALPPGAPALAPRSPFFVLVPGAKSLVRRWPSASFAALADRLDESTGWPGVICGTAEERPLADEIAGRSRAKLHIAAGETGLVDCARLIRAAELAISNESSAAHIAGAVQTRSVCVLGGGHYGRFLPYPSELFPAATAPRVAAFEMPCFGCDWHCIYPLADGAPAPCVSEVSVEVVWRQVKEALAE